MKTCLTCKYKKSCVKEQFVSVCDKWEHALPKTRKYVMIKCPMCHKRHKDEADLAAGYRTVITTCPWCDCTILLEERV